MTFWTIALASIPYESACRTSVFASHGAFAALAFQPRYSYVEVGNFVSLSDSTFETSSKSCAWTVAYVS